MKSIKEQEEVMRLTNQAPDAAELLAWAKKARAHLKYIADYWDGPIGDKAEDIISDLPEEP